MKKSAFALLALLLCVCLCFSACTSDCLFQNDKYSITSKNGKYYFNFKNKLTFKNEFTAYQGLHGMQAVPRIEFSSPKEMQQKVLSGNISDEKIYEFQLYADIVYHSDRLEMVDITTVYQPTVPEGFTLSDYVTWYGNNYKFLFTGNNGVSSGSITCCSKKLWDDTLEYELYIDEHFEILSDCIIADRNARRIHYKIDAAEQIQLQYDIVVDDITLTVIEDYRLDHSAEHLWAPRNPSDTAPYKISVFGINNHMSFVFRFSDPTERPSMEWLSSLGMTECK